MEEDIAHLFACIEREQGKRYELGKPVVLFMCPLFSCIWYHYN